MIRKHPANGRRQLGGRVRAPPLQQTARCSIQLGIQRHILGQLQLPDLQCIPAFQHSTAITNTHTPSPLHKPIGNSRWGILSTTTDIITITVTFSPGAPAAHASPQTRESPPATPTARCRPLPPPRPPPTAAPGCSRRAPGCPPPRRPRWRARARHR